MARLFNGNGSTTNDPGGATVDYNATDAKFETKGTNYAAPFDYGTTAAFANKVDMSAVSNATDCGECHVGGGGMQYIPNANMSARIPLREAQNAGGLLDPAAGKVTALDYFVDGYDVNGNGNKEEVLYNDYSTTGVVEMDCLMCHLQGYNYEAGKGAKRLNMFDASRALAAGIAVNDKFTESGHHVVATNPGAFGTAGWGTGVTYDTTKVVSVNGVDGAAGYKLASGVVAAIQPTPVSENCEHCHFAVHAVDWKKRGEKWDPSHEVHYGIGCMGCHEREVEDYTQAGDTGVFRGTGVTAKLGMCDPAKGGGSAFDALSQTLDNVEHKSCADCHLATGTETFKIYGAPNPTAAHAAKGLNYVLLQAAGTTNGTANASHLDVIACESCHIKKDATITGGAWVDGTGPDQEGRLATHDNQYVERDMDDAVALYWQGGKLYPGNLLTSAFWRSKNDMFYDANSDGRKGGADGLLQTHIASANAQGFGKYDYRNALFADGVLTSTEIATSITNIELGLDALNGQSAPGTGSRAVKLSFVTVPFKNTHNIAPASQARGAGGCTDCHGNAKGFYNGVYDLTGKSTIAWTKSTQMTPFTKVNGNVDPVDTHPNMKDKKGIRSVPVDLRGATTIRNADRSEYIYETTFQTRDGAWKTSIEGGWFTFGTASDIGAVQAGNLLKLDTTTDGGTTVVARTKQIPGTSNPTSCSALETSLGKFADNINTFGFNVDCTDGDGTNGGAVGQGKLTITSGNKAGETNAVSFRLHPQSDVGSLGLKDALWKLDPVTPTQQAVFNGVDTNANGKIDGQAEMLAYLNAIGSVALAPQANILHVSAAAYTSGDLEAATSATAVTVTKGATINLVADQPAALLTPTYSWSCSDGGDSIAGVATPTRVFNSTGTYMLTLTVNAGNGNITTDTVYVKVVAPAAQGPATWADVSDAPDPENNFTGELSVTGLPTHTKINVYWGDSTAYTADLGAGDHTVAHTFVPQASLLVNGTTYHYPVTVRAYNGRYLVKSFTVYVDIAKP